MVQVVVLKKILSNVKIICYNAIIAQDCDTRICTALLKLCANWDLTSPFLSRKSNKLCSCREIYIVFVQFSDSLKQKKFCHLSMGGTIVESHELLLL